MKILNKDKRRRSVRPKIMTADEQYLKVMCLRNNKTFSKDMVERMVSVGGWLSRSNS